nr:LysR substrate-binding domain-containing protein [Mangrovicoccus ximenensis]
MRAIESVARLGAIWRAAEELNVTRSAISHQLRLLERDLGFKILERYGNATEITPRAQAYAAEVRRALSMIAASSVRAAQEGLSGTLTVSCPPGFASGWLCLHIRDFAERHPDIVLRIHSARNLAETDNPEIDTFITFGHELRAHVAAEPLVKVEFTPLCSPAYLTRFNGFGDIRALQHATLLHIGDFTDWEDWLQIAGLPAEMGRRGICYSDMNVVYTAVLAGEGIAIGDTVIWRQALENGQLVRPFSPSLHTETGYYLCTPEANLENPLVREFHNWLKRRLEMNHMRPEGDG